MTVVALIDGPLSRDCPALRTTNSFCDLHPHAANSPAAQHARHTAAAILINAPFAQLDNYQVFPGSLACTVQAVCEALRYAAESDAEVVNCSFGIPRNAPELSDAVELVLGKGKHIVASAPARGAAVYPAMYKGVFSVQGDARCSADKWSWLGLPHALFGASASFNGRNHGASVAAAHFTGHLLHAIDTDRVGEMQTDAAFQGRERILYRTTPNAP